MVSRIEKEIHHGAKIRENAEDIWNWSSPAGKLRVKRRAQYFLELTGMNSKHYVLEIGCGTGIFTSNIAKSGAKIIAVDLSNALLNIAKHKNIDNCNFQQVDVHRLPYKNNSFDIILGSSVLHHLDMKIALKEIFRTLKPSGQIVFAEPNMLNPQILIQKNIPFIKEKAGDSPDETAIIRWQIAKTMKSLGFININIFPYDFLHPGTPIFLINAVQGIGRLIEKIPLLKEIAGSLIIYAQKCI